MLLEALRFQTVFVYIHFRLKIRSKPHQTFVMPPFYMQTIEENWFNCISILLLLT